MKNVNLIIFYILLTISLASCKKDDSTNYSDFYIVTLTPQKTSTGTVRLRGQLLATSKISVIEYGFKIVGNGTTQTIPVSTSGTNFNKIYSIEQTLDASTNYSVSAYAYTKPGDSTYLRQGNFQNFVPANLTSSTQSISIGTIDTTNNFGNGLYIFKCLINNPNSESVIEYGFECISKTSTSNNKLYTAFSSASPNTTPTINVSFDNSANMLAIGDTYVVNAYVITLLNGTPSKYTSTPVTVHPF